MEHRARLRVVERARRGAERAPRERGEVVGQRHWARRAGGEKLAVERLVGGDLRGEPPPATPWRRLRARLAAGAVPDESEGDEA